MPANRDGYNPDVPHVDLTKVAEYTAVRALVRDPGKAQRLFGDSPHLETIRTRLDDPAAVAAGLIGSDTVFLSMGSVGLQADALSCMPMSGRQGNRVHHPVSG